jgi:hypothetical protein
MADKAALELIGVMLFAATLLVVGAGGFAVRHQLAADAQKANTVAVAQLPSHGLRPIGASLAPVSSVPHLVK